MGEVFAATDDRLGRAVALKCVRTDRVSDAARKRILREARAMAKLAHPNVVTIHEVGEDEGQLFIVMELVDGDNLARWATREKPGWREVVRVYQQAGRGLAAAHKAGLVHRDFKPHNAMLGTDGRVRVLDFGLVSDTESEDDDAGRDELADTAPEAASLDLTASRLTQSGAIMGSPAYMSPEQFRGRPADARSDQFSFCVALYEALHDKRPFSGKSLAELANNVVEGQLAPEIDSAAVPTRLRRIVARGLAADPDERWPTMDDLVDTLAGDPTRGRRVWLGGGVVGLAALGMLAWWRVDRARTVSACEAEGNAIHGVWNDTTIEDHRLAFEASGAPLASNAWARTSPRLDAYAQAWAQQRTRLCLDAELDAAVTPSHAGSAVRCLDAYRAQFEALVVQLATPDAETAARAVPAAASLPPLQSCADERWLILLPDAPNDADTRTRVAAVRQQLARSRSHQWLGRYAEARDEAKAAREAAAALDDPPLHAEADFEVAATLIRLGEFDDAVTTMERAFFAADRVGHDELAARAATLIASVEGADRERFDRALHWHRLGEARLQRIGLATGHLVAAQLADALGAIQEARADYDAALQAHERALAIKQEVLGDEHPSWAATMHSIGRAQWGQGNAEAAIASYRRALATQERVLGESHPKIASALGNLASLLAIHGELDQALALHERTLTITEAALGPDHPSLATSLSNRGLAYEMQGRYDEAEASYRRALEIWKRAKGPEHPDIALSLTNIASVYKKIGRRPEAMALTREALAIWEAALGPDHPDVATALIELGNMHLSAKELDPAMAAYTRAADVLRTALGPEHNFVAVALGGIGDVHRAEGRHAEALDQYEQVLAIRVSNKAPATDMADTRFAIAKALLATGGDRSRALALATQARDDYAKFREAKNRDKVDRWLAALGP